MDTMYPFLVCNFEKYERGNYIEPYRDPFSG